MPKASWKTRKRGTKRQIGKRYIADRTSRRGKVGKLKRVRGKGTLSTWNVDFKNPDVWNMLETIQIPARTKSGAIRKAKAMGLDIVEVRFSQKVEDQDKQIDGISKGRKVRIVERVERPEDYTYYRWDDQSWLLVKPDEEDDEVAGFEVKGTEQDVEHLARTIDRIADRLGYEEIHMTGGDRVIGKKVDRRLQELWD